jgi:hypothetical protein
MLLLCVFIVGVFFGIWMDWSAWKHKVGQRDLVFEVQDYPMANLQVHAGDRITLVPPPGGNGNGLLMNFVGYSPCTSGLTPTNPCIVDAEAAAGPYLFTCNSGAGYTCPDPGVQQQPTSPLEDLSYPGFVKRDFTHLLGMRRAAVPKPGPSKMAGAHPATSGVTAYVSCQNGTTVLQDPNGNSLTTITASRNETVFWISARPFSLDMSSAPAGLCSNGNPGSGNTQQAQCDIALSGQTVQYKVQAQTTPACSALAATLITK